MPDIQLNPNFWGKTIDVTRSHFVPIVALIFLISLIALYFLFNGEYHRTTNASGYLYPQEGIVKVYAQHPGNITTIYVTQGDKVSEGDPLLKVSSNISAKDGEVRHSILTKNLHHKLAILDKQIIAVSARTKGKKKELSALLHNTQQQVTILKTQVIEQQQLVKQAREILEKNQHAFKQKFIALPEINKAFNNFTQTKNTLAQLQQSILNQQQQQHQYQTQLDAIQYNNDIAQLKAQKLEVQMRLTDLRGEYTITAPGDGYISLLSSKIGQTVGSSSGALMQITKERQPMLEAHLFLHAQAAGFISQGQEIYLQYDAYPHQKFGSFIATVSSVDKISSSSRHRMQIAAKDKGEIYMVKARLEQQSIPVFNDTIALKPGLTLQASLMLEKRSLIEWLFEPYFSALRRTRKL